MKETARIIAFFMTVIMLTSAIRGSTRQPALSDRIWMILDYGKKQAYTGAAVGAGLSLAIIESQPESRYKFMIAACFITSGLCFGEIVGIGVNYKTNPEQ